MHTKFYTLLVGLLLVVGALPRWSAFDSADNILYDLFYEIRGERNLPDNVLFVFLDEQDIQVLGGWPLTRDYWGYVIHQTGKAGAKAIAIDVLFTTENQLFREYDKTLVEFTAAAGNVILPIALEVVPQADSVFVNEIIHPFPDLNKAVKAVGFANLGDETTVRRVPVSVRHKGKEYNSFGVELARALRADSNEQFSGLLPEDDYLEINYAGLVAPEESISFLEYLQALREDAAALQLQDKLVLIAPIAPGLPIVRHTPFADVTPASLIHLNVAENILRQNALQRVPWFFHGLIMVMAGFVIFLAFWNISIRQSAVVLISIVVGYVVLSYFLFAHASFILPIFYHLLSFVLFSLLVYYEKEKQNKITYQAHSNRLWQEIMQKQRTIDDAEKELFTMRKQLQFEQAKSENAAQEKEKKIREKQQEVSNLQKQLNDLQAFEKPAMDRKKVAKITGIIHADNSPLNAVIDLVQTISDDDIPVLIMGETGTGKEVLAQAIHNKSRRHNKPFVAVNCGALSESLLESELFGHEKGAFTGAQSLRRGRFELANGGTIFLDEISETSPAFQARLLRVLQEGVIERLGGERTIRINVRCIAACNQDIRKLVDAGAFRADLYYRLNGFPIVLPALRQRSVDIPILATHFLHKYDFDDLKFSETVLESLRSYAWPGNIRELENTVRRMGILAKSEQKSLIQTQHLPEDIRTFRQEIEEIADYAPLEEQILTRLRELKFSRAAISQTARLLGNKDRGTITEYLRGLCFESFVQNEFDREKAAAALAGTNDSEVIKRVFAKLDSYLKNLDPEQKGRNHSQYKGLPQKYHPKLDAVLDFLGKPQGN
ncbi:MAG: CHASE2 domain-containing protein [Calditrichaeota bacterium]|nr:MAG: CHASE2 domain-containing protein [Calditrichota bacterium]